MEKQIEALTGHYIICGFGRIGSLICEEFKTSGLKSSDEIIKQHRKEHHGK